MNDRNTIVKEIEGRSKIVLLLLNGIEKSGKNQRLLPLAETLRIAPQIKPSKTQPLKKIGYPIKLTHAARQGGYFMLLCNYAKCIFYETISAFRDYQVYDMVYTPS